MPGPQQVPPRKNPRRQNHMIAEIEGLIVAFLAVVFGEQKPGTGYRTAISIRWAFLPAINGVVPLYHPRNGGQSMGLLEL